MGSRRSVSYPRHGRSQARLPTVTTAIWAFTSAAHRSSGWGDSSAAGPAAATSPAVRERQRNERQVVEASATTTSSRGARATWAVPRRRSTGANRGPAQPGTGSPGAGSDATAPGAGPRVILSFSPDVEDLLVSGGLMNAEELAGAPALDRRPARRRAHRHVQLRPVSPGFQHRVVFAGIQYDHELRPPRRRQSAQPHRRAMSSPSTSRIGGRGSPSSDRNGHLLGRSSGMYQWRLTRRRRGGIAAGLTTAARVATPPSGSWPAEAWSPPGPPTTDLGTRWFGSRGAPSTPRCRAAEYPLIEGRGSASISSGETVTKYCA